MPTPKFKPTTEFPALSHEQLRQLRGYSLPSLMKAPGKIPTKPGVYVWRYWPSLKTLDKGDFATVLSTWTARQPAFTDFLNGPRTTAEIVRRPFGFNDSDSNPMGIDLNSAKGQRFMKAMTESPEARQTLFGLLECIISAIPPLYIGKADNLQARLDSHFQARGSRVLEMINSQKIPHDEIYISYFIDSISTSPDSSITTVLEEIAQRLTNPPFTKRIG